MIQKQLVKLRNEDKKTNQKRTKKPHSNIMMNLGDETATRKNSQANKKTNDKI